LLSKNIKIKISRTITMPGVLYGHETWSLTLTEEHRLRVFKNRVLRKIHGPKRDEVKDELRRLYNEELHNLYSSTKYYFSNKIKKSQMGEASGMYVGEDRCIQGFGGEI
jgi:hypothetical protein